MSDTAERRLFFYMAKHEGALARLYRAFAHAFPAYRGLFLEMSREEIHHARWITTLRDAGDTAIVERSGIRFNLDLVQTNIQVIEDLLRRLARHDLPLLEAVDQAIGFENAMLEKRFFALFIFKGEQGRSIQRTLKAETDKHRAKLDRLQADLARA